MPQNITLGYRALVDAANKEVETVPTAEAIKLAGRDGSMSAISANSRARAGYPAPSTVRAAC